MTTRQKTSPAGMGIADILVLPDREIKTLQMALTFSGVSGEPQLCRLQIIRMHLHSDKGGPIKPADSQPAMCV